MLALTDTAAHAIESILSTPAIPDGAGVRISAAPGTEAEAAEAGRLNVAIAQEPEEGDRVIDERGARVFVGDRVARYLEDKLLDAQVAGDQVSFLIGAQAQTG